MRFLLKHPATMGDLLFSKKFPLSNFVFCGNMVLHTKNKLLENPLEPASLCPR
jgi:hypothetical protein